MRDRYTPDEWELLVELPRSVVIAATSAEADGRRSTVEEGLAGRDGLKAGESDASALVREVYADLSGRESGLNPGEVLAAEEFNDRSAGLASVLGRARTASLLLTTKADPVDAVAYRQWLGRIADTVSTAATTGGFLGLGGERVSNAEQRFVEDLGKALA